MLIRIVQLDIQPEHTELFLQLYSSHQEIIRTNPGCVSLQLLQEDQNPNHVATLSYWATEEDLNYYRNSEFFRKLWSTVKPLFASPAKAFSYHNWPQGTSAL